LLQVLGIPSPLHRDSRGGTIDVPKIVRRKFDRNCSAVLIQAFQLARTRDRNNPRFLGKQPGKCYLSRCRLLLFCDLSQQQTVDEDCTTPNESRLLA